MVDCSKEENSLASCEEEGPMLCSEEENSETVDSVEEGSLVASDVGNDCSCEPSEEATDEIEVSSEECSPAELNSEESELDGPPLLEISVDVALDSELATSLERWDGEDSCDDIALEDVAPDVFPRGSI